MIDWVIFTIYTYYAYIGGLMAMKIWLHRTVATAAFMLPHWSESKMTKIKIKIFMLLSYYVLKCHSDRWQNKRQKEGAKGQWTSTECGKLIFSYLIFTKKGCSHSFDWVKWNFAIVIRPLLNRFIKPAFWQNTPQMYLFKMNTQNLFA